MSKEITEKGSCLCGSIRFTANNIDYKVTACHCSMCRKWGGGPLMAVHCGTDISFTGEQNISVYNSSSWAERGFCKRCGSHLFYRLKQNLQYSIPVGLFDNNKKFTLDQQFFIDKKPSFYSFSNHTKNLTEAEVFAKYTPSGN